MKYLQNLHTHSTYCDGKNTLEEMVQGAIEKGFDSLGFSGHSYTSFWPEYCMTLEGTEEYKKEIRRLQKKYQDQIEIFCGLELDRHSDGDRTGFDYTIGSVHSFKIGEKYIDFDQPAAVVKKIIQEYFSGDSMAYVKKYYETVSELPECGNIDFVGHFDIITKHSEKETFFDADSPEYKKIALDALDTVASRIKLFEINSGAIARGYRSTPYPALFLLKEMKQRGCGIVITADCHDYRYLYCHFREMETILKECGFKEHYVLTKTGFQALPLEE